MIVVLNLRNKSLEELLQKYNRPEVKCLTMVKIGRILPTNVSYAFQTSDYKSAY